ncbi:hypothetical protein MUN89_02600 [Halobacillus salinarum]|uniref:Uncharacterized protein n=1 Tax=Halobacillus salinarum TaxID=2932257 RepID=A0ABY4EL79_9BACI|nr:hypothetical protein [Halobacillus salinarum]UOQ44863.1 hypothetical protein MUN89_02600 [Halobacillus salinarum]
MAVENERYLSLLYFFPFFTLTFSVTAYTFGVAGLIGGVGIIVSIICILLKKSVSSAWKSMFLTIAIVIVRTIMVFTIGF